jgi:eukaryotic-like serine/threonine-protein kinase
MEFIPGQTLARILAERRLSLDEVFDFATQIASALSAAHAAGVVHRDIKPGNVVINEAGVAKVLDFGLAKLRESSVTADETTATVGPQTLKGDTHGTAAYMSPEQAQGKLVDSRSDIFSFGAVFYEMLTGRRAFDGSSLTSVLGQVLSATPPPVRELRAEVPEELVRVLNRCLEKDAEARYASGKELVHDLQACRKPAGSRKSPLVLPVAASLVIAVIAGGAWLYVRNSRARWVRNEALPQIRAAIIRDDMATAFELTGRGLRYTSDDPQLQTYWSEVSLPATIRTEPQGARVSWKPYLQPGAAWRVLGDTPIDMRVPSAHVRVHVEKPGFESVDQAIISAFLSQPFALLPVGKVPAGMVWVPPGSQNKAYQPAALDEYFLDKFEVSNRQFKQFVDEGGYTNAKYWHHPFRKDGGQLKFEESMAVFTDATGRRGPSSWHLATYPEDRAEHPVGGVSWFEAAAYCAYAGKTLPTAHHWRYAAGYGPNSDILLLSNFRSQGSAAVGSHAGMGPFGTHDMAGNVKEWTWTESGDRRIILGGAWNEESYMFRDFDAQLPWKREPSYGFRCAVYAKQPPAETLAPIANPAGDITIDEPVDDKTFEIYRRMYAYDRSAVEGKSEAVDDSHELWRKEKVSYTAAYGGERMFAYLYIPKNAKPPYQTIVYFPGGWALFIQSSDQSIAMGSYDYLMRTGRAVLFPVYKGTFERRVKAAGPNTGRDLTVQRAKDVFRSIDYLETRNDIDKDRIGYYGISMGAVPAPIFTALEPRIKAAILVGGALFRSPKFPEVDPLNLAPRVRTPVLMLNGRLDFQMDLETRQKPLFRLLGPPEEHKKHVTFETGHFPPPQDTMRESLAWFDKYLGPVTPKQ